MSINRAYANKVRGLTFIWVVICIFVGHILSANAIGNFALILVAGIFFGSVVKKPEYAILLTMLAFTNFLGYVDMDTFGHLPGIIKLSDIVILSMFLYMVFNIVCKKERLSNIFKSPMSMPILALFSFSVFKMAHLTLIGGSTFLETFKAGRYLLELCFLFFIILYFIKDERQLRNLLWGISIIGIITALFYLAGFFKGTKPLLIPDILEVEAIESTAHYRRLYFPSGGFMTIAFIFNFWWLMTQKTKLAYIATIICGLGILLTFLRTVWIGIIFGIIFCVIFLIRDRSKIYGMVYKAALLLILIIAFLTMLGSHTEYGEVLNLRFFTSRFKSGFEDFIGKSGTYGYRLAYHASMIDAAKRHLIFGVGFVHPESYLGRGVSSVFYGTTHSAIIDVLFKFGSVGFLLYGWLLGACFKRVFSCLSSIKNRSNGFYREILFGAITYLVYCITSMFTMNPLTGKVGFLALVCVMSIIEVTCRFLEVAEAP